MTTKGIREASGISYFDVVATTMLIIPQQVHMRNAIERLIDAITTIVITGLENCKSIWTLLKIGHQS